MLTKKQNRALLNKGPSASCSPSAVTVLFEASESASYLEISALQFPDCSPRELAICLNTDSYV
jgi:hypothetical protein